MLPQRAVKIHIQSPTYGKKYLFQCAKSMQSLCKRSWGAEAHEMCNDLQSGMKHHRRISFSATSEHAQDHHERATAMLQPRRGHDHPWRLQRGSWGRPASFWLTPVLDGTSCMYVGARRGRAQPVDGNSPLGCQGLSHPDLCVFNTANKSLDSCNQQQQLCMHIIGLLLLNRV